MKETRTTAEFDANVLGMRLSLELDSGNKVPIRDAAVDPHSVHAVAISRGRNHYTWQQVSLFPIRVWLSVMAYVSVLTLAVYLVAAMGPLDPSAAGPLLHEFIAGFQELRTFLKDEVGTLYHAIVGPRPTVGSAAATAATAYVGQKVLGTLSRASGARHQRVPAVPTAVSTSTAPSTLNADDLVAASKKRKARIAGVRLALKQLDAEWLSYEMDLDAYYLTKPLLRDPDVAQTAAYQAALYELRTRAEDLGKSSTATEIDNAEQAADAALLAWGTANDHAQAMGVTDRSPTERAALRRLHALTGQLADPSTPEPMCRSLIEAISREMAKLTTVPATWDHLSRVPALEHRNPVAIAAVGQE